MTYRPNATYQGFDIFFWGRIYDLPQDRRKYAFDFSDVSGARAEFYFTGDNVARFIVSDIGGESYSVDLPIGSNGVPTDGYIFLVCQIGITEQSSGMSIYVN